MVKIELLAESGINTQGNNILNFTSGVKWAPNPIRNDMLEIKDDKDVVIASVPLHRINYITNKEIVG